MTDGQAVPGLAARVDAVDWEAVTRDLGERGFATTGQVLRPDEARSLAALYDRPDGFRSTVVMARHGFGRGEYRYFDRPLPPVVDTLRQAFYRRLAPVARAWAPALGLSTPFPDDLDGFAAVCAAAGQTKPTPLLLRYGPGDHNRLHQDVYGDVVFPLQVTVLLSQPGDDFSGGHFLLVEQRPRMQSRGDVVPLGLGDAVVFATRQWPARGRASTYRVVLRHGVTTVTGGCRTTLGLIFHEAA